MRYNVLVTGAGAPGTIGTVECIRDAFSKARKKVTIYGSDCNQSSIGRIFVDKFVYLPHGEDPLYVDRLTDLCKYNNIDVVVPQTTPELPKIASLRSYGAILAAISSPLTISTAENKAKLLKTAQLAGVPVPNHEIIHSIKELEDAAYKLGYPDKTLTIKPSVSSGSRGFRILSANKNKSIKRLIESKQSFQSATVDELMSYNEDAGETEFVVSEFLPGEEYSVDAFVDPASLKSVYIPRIRNKIVNGISFESTSIGIPCLMEYSSRLAYELGAFYCFGFQFKEDENNIPKLIECNCRVQGTMIAAFAAGANIIGASVMSVLGLKMPEFSIKWGVKTHRYWGSVLEDGPNDVIIYP